jgi:hypothetical protein
MVESASRTSSSLNGLMTAETIFMLWFLCLLQGALAGPAPGSVVSVWAGKEPAPLKM